MPARGEDQDPEICRWQQDHGCMASVNRLQALRS